ncbi:MAG: tRNA epoxyqueuosine(34) reductase QueG [Tissierellia bacterium]|nr:tRNA epoxyqueuosine(34) reductase QueG [Tissierellia bacterium]
MIDLNNYKNKIEFDIIGITKAEKLIYLEDFLIERLNSSKTCEFESKDLQKRIDPKANLFNAKSVITCAINYYYPYKYLEHEKYLISMSSFGLDYHKVLREKLESFVAILKRDYDFNYLIQIDSGPLIEREYSLKSGIGFIGKNCNLITKLGSFVFIGLIILDRDVKLDYEKFKGDCKDCNICIKACPTKALSPYRCDASKCLSYLTQKKGELLASEQKLFKNFVYGCDICQRVCPMNKNIKPNEHPEFQPMITSLNREEIQNMSNREFKRQYQKHAFSWRGKGIILRNMDYIDKNR